MQLILADIVIDGATLLNDLIIAIMVVFFMGIFFSVFRWWPRP